MTAPQPSPKQSLTHATTRGYAYMLIQSGGSQVVNFGGFLVLGWLLTDAEFGLFAMVMTVATSAELIRQIGLRTILVDRYRHYERWASPVFWLSLLLGITSMLVMIGIAPLVERLYDEEGLTGLIIVMSLSMPLTAIGNVPEAKLQAELEFRYLAGVQFGFVVFMMLGMVLLAWAGFGAYALAIPRPLGRLMQLIAFWWKAPPALRLRPQIRRWRYLFSDAAKLTTSNATYFVISQFDYVMLSAFHSKAVVGVYFYAFAISQRTIVVLTTSLRDVLFPALSRLHHDPVRQAAAFLRASRLLAIMGAPACLLQAAVAEPAFRTILPESKIDAAVVLQILSLGTIFRLIGQPALALLSAQSRFGRLMVLNIGLAVTFIIATVFGVAFGAANAMAVAISVYFGITGPIQIYVAIRPAGGGVRDVMDVLFRPILGAVIAVGSVWLMGEHLLPDGRLTPWIRLFGIPPLAMLVYIPVIALLCPTDARDLLGRIRSLIRRAPLDGVADGPDPTAGDDVSSSP